MPTPSVYNGVSYNLPAPGEINWGTDVTAFLVSLAANAPVKGAIVNADINAAAAIQYSKLALSNSIVNADINTSAAIAYSKLNLATSIVNADINASAAIAYSKLNLATSIVNADISASAAIAYSKLNLGTSIVNADISASAAIAYSKLALTGAILNADLAGSIAYGKLSLSGSIVNSDISVSAAIAYSKLALTGAIVNADLAGSIAYGKLNLTGSIVNADVAGAAAIQRSKLDTGSVDHVVINNGLGAFSSEAQLAISRGGSGQATANAALNAFLPAQSGNNGRVLGTDGTNTSWVAGGGSSTGINYVLNSDFETGATTGWAAYADAAGTTPVDGTGGAPNVTIAASTSSPLRGTNSLLFTKDAANRQGQGFSYDFTIASADVSRPLQITAELEASANYVASDMGVYIYDVTNAAIITPSIVNIPAGTSKFIANFNATTSTSYRLIFHVQTVSATDYTLKADSISVGPSILAVGPVVSDPVSFTPSTNSSVTFGTLYGSYLRVGSTAKVNVLAETSAGTGSGGSPFLITLPSVLTIAAGNYSGARITIFNSAASSSFSDEVDIIADGTNVIKIGTPKFRDPIALVDLAHNSNNFINGFTINADLPITTWSGSGNVVNGPNVEYAYNTSTNATTSDTTSFGYGPQGNLIGSITSALNRRVRFQYPTQPTDNFCMEVSSDRITWNVLDSFRIVGGSGVVPYQLQNAVSYGAGIYAPQNSTDVDIRFGQYEQPSGATFGAAGEAWRAGGSDQYWRVKKESGVAATALSEAVPGVSNGFLSFNGVKGATDGSAAIAGYVGQYIESVISTLTSWGAATSTYFDATSISLTAGDWDVTALFFYNNNSATPGSGGLFSVGIGTASGTSTTGLVGGSNEFTLPTSTHSGTFAMNATVPSFRVSLSSTATIYLKAVAIFTAGTPQYRCRISARRVR